MNFAEVDMRLRDRRAQAGERLLEGDRAGFLIQIKMKRALAVGGEDGCWGFVESDHLSSELLGIGRCTEQHEGATSRAADANNLQRMTFLPLRTDWKKR